MNGFSASNIGRNTTLAGVQEQSDTEVSLGSRSNVHNYIANQMNRRQIPDASVLLEVKKAKEFKKYAIMGLIAYYVFC